MLSNQPVLIIVSYCLLNPNPMFFTEFSKITTSLSPLCLVSHLVGDFNIHMDSNTCNMANEFAALLCCLCYTQLTDFPTHNCGHILDLVCSNGLSVNTITGTDLGISDYKIIYGQ